MEPRLLLLDEPLSNLDAKLLARVHPSFSPTAGTMVHVGMDPAK